MRRAKRFQREKRETIPQPFVAYIVGSINEIEEASGMRGALDGGCAVRLCGRGNDSIIVVAWTLVLMPPAC
jgi:hypothetical protein